jgi:threonine dehydratase
VELVVHGRDFQEALEHAQKLAKERDLHLVPSFDFRLVGGVAGAALELLRAVPALATLYVPVGLGSGICGAIAARDALGRRTEIVGVVAAQAPAYADSFSARRSLPRPVGATIADGLACRVPDPSALAAILQGAARIVTVGEREIRSAMRALFADTHNVAEGAGAAGFAALLQERGRPRTGPLGIMLTGGNVDGAAFADVLAEGAADRPGEPYPARDDP